MIKQLLTISGKVLADGDVLAVESDVEDTLRLEDLEQVGNNEGFYNNNQRDSSLELCDSRSKLAATTSRSV